ncbi:MAG: outer membrane lipoprotein-sorting protein [Deltaproteobacteria bacterium]|nr:outer membrane lipoprotein-sorting protein [Deltaproteobacteria bacterium]
MENVYQQGKTWIMKTMTMEDVQKDHRTVIDIVESKQSDFPDEYFTERFLTQTDRY